MGTPEYLKCPGSDPLSNALPELYQCPECLSDIEIWADESGGRCPSCKTYYRRAQVKKIPDKPSSQQNEDKLNDLVRYAYELGATNVAIIPTDRIIAEPYLSDRCKEPRCENYGLSKSCPPYVAGPLEFRKQLVNFSTAIFFRIDVPSELIFSGERREIFQLLHEVAAGIEIEAIKKGYTNSQAFAGGSCKKIFCHSHVHCSVIAEGGTCRHEQYARPSMSGFGINVPVLFEAAGWPTGASNQDAGATTTKLAQVCGLILIN